MLLDDNIPGQRAENWLELAEQLRRAAAPWAEAEILANQPTLRTAGRTYPVHARR